MRTSLPKINLISHVDVGVDFDKVDRMPLGGGTLQTHLTEFSHMHACGELLDADPRLTSGVAFVGGPVRRVMHVM